MNRKRSSYSELIGILVYVGVIWYMADRDRAVRYYGALRQRARAVEHRLSVWDALREIRSLPEK